MEEWTQFCSMCAAEKLVCFCSRDCDFGLCWAHCAGREGCSRCARSRSRADLGPADAVLSSGPLRRLEKGTGREEGGHAQKREVERETKRWRTEQREALAKYVQRRFCGALFDADEAARCVPGKTSTQCAKLVRLMELALPAQKNDEGGGGDDDDDDDDDDYFYDNDDDIAYVDEEEEEEEEEEEDREEQSTDYLRRNMVFFKAALKGFLRATLEPLCRPGKRRVVNGKHVLALLNKRK